MSQDRDNAQTRENINRVAKDHHRLIKKADPTYTFDQATRRVSKAREKGDRKRENGNR